MAAPLAAVRRLAVKNPFDPQEKSPRRRKLLLALTTALLLCAAVCLGLLCLYFATLYYQTTDRFVSYFSSAALVALNVAPVVALVALLWLLTDRAWLSFLLSGALSLTLTFVNYYKVVLRDDPLVFEDIAYAGEAAGVVGEYSIHFSGYFKVGIALWLLGTLVLFVFARGRIGCSWRRRLARGLSAVALCAVCVAGWFGIYRSDARYDSFENYTYFNRWRPAEDYASRGFVYPFLHSIAGAYPAAPEGYSAASARAALDAAGDGSMAPEQKVNVICVMLESFSDLTDAGELRFTEDPYAPLRELEDECISGTMISDTLGGGTCNSERSFLTGTLYPQPDYRHDSWSYVRYFSAQGYHTEGLHPGYDWYYNRQVVDLNLGFDEYYFNENYFDARTEEEHAGDAVFFSALSERYAARDRDVPYFNFSITYQGHGPYPDSELSWGREYLSREGISEACYYTVNNYLGGVADTLQQLSAFLDTLREDTEPVVVLVFGDHKPTLGSGNGCYAELGIDLGRETEEGFCNYYATKYLIWGNDAAKAALGRELQGEGPTVGPYFLMNVLFEACGWEGPAFLKISDTLRQTAPVVHSTGVYLVSDALCDTPADGGAALETFRSVQYYLRKKAY